MKSFTMWALALGFVLCFSLTPAMGQYTIWHSPLTFSTEDSRLTVSQSCCPSTTIRVTTSEAGDLQWVELGLVIPSNVNIDSAFVFYELNSSSSFISQVRLTQTTTPDAAFVQHDDATDLTDVGPTGYSSFVGGLVADGTITLALRLNFADPSDWIDIGGIGIFVSPIVTSVQQRENSTSPEAYGLKQNYPNPFNPKTVIEYEIQRAGGVELRIYNSTGQRVRTLVDEEKSEGFYRVLWDGKDDHGQILASGVYFYRLKTGEFVGAKRMLLLK